MGLKSTMNTSPRWSASLCNPTSASWTAFSTQCLGLLGAPTENPRHSKTQEWSNMQKMRTPPAKTNASREAASDSEDDDFASHLVHHLEGQHAASHLRCPSHSEGSSKDGHCKAWPAVLWSCECRWLRCLITLAKWFKTPVVWSLELYKLYDA